MRALIPLKLQGVSEWAVRDMFNWPLKALVDTDQFWLVGASWNLAWWHSRCWPFFFNSMIPWCNLSIFVHSMFLRSEWWWFGPVRARDQAWPSLYFSHSRPLSAWNFRRPASWSAFLFYCKAAHGIPHSTSGGRLHASHAGRTEKDGTFILYIDTVPMIPVFLRYSGALNAGMKWCQLM